MIKHAEPGRGVLSGGTAMDIPVLIEKLENSQFRARSGEPLPLTAEGATREQALERLRHLLESRLSAGAELTSLELGAKHPLAEFAGMLDPKDPMTQEWLDIMPENRRREDEELGIR